MVDRWGMWRRRFPSGLYFAVVQSWPVLLMMLSLAAGCDQVRSWRDTQVAQSHRSAQGSKVAPPTQPIAIPDSVRRELPLDDSFTVLNYSEQGEAVSLTALSPWDAEKTALWLVARLGELGYDSGDNPSRVIDGANYERSHGPYRSLYVKLNLNTANQCTVDYRAY